MKPPRSLEQLDRQIVACDRCVRLRDYCTEVARTKRAAFATQTYWGKPVPGFGDPQARLWIIGLAPAAHGANRTGRVFTGDRSGDFLFAALHRTGFANQPTSVRHDDGLQLTGCFISATARCAPPDNKPLPIEVANCAGYLDAELKLLSRVRVILALGGIAWAATKQLIVRNRGPTPEMSKAAFAHGGEYRVDSNLTLLASYHVSQQNTFTGRLTEAMFDAVLKRCRDIMNRDG